MPFFDIHISQGSVETCLKRGGIFKHEFVANLLPSLLMKKFENRIRVSEVMAKSLVSCFLTHGVHVRNIKACCNGLSCTCPDRESWRLSLSHCWLGVTKSIRSVKIEWWGVGVVISLERGADCLSMVQLMLGLLHPKTPSSLASFKCRLVLPFWYRPTQVVLKTAGPSETFQGMSWFSGGGTKIVGGVRGVYLIPYTTRFHELQILKKRNWLFSTFSVHTFWILVEQLNSLI